MLSAANYKLFESLKMDQCDSGSILNISASAALDASIGIFESGDAKRDNKCQPSGWIAIARQMTFVDQFMSDAPNKLHRCIRCDKLGGTAYPKSVGVSRKYYLHGCCLMMRTISLRIAKRLEIQKKHYNGHQIHM